MSNCGCSPAPSACCTPAQQCNLENFGLAFPSLVGPMGPPGGPGTYVENYAALRALDATVFTNGYVAWVSGYAASNDGGGGNFAYNSASVVADNDGTIISPANGVGRWYRIFSGAVNVQWFGADRTGVTDASTPIQNAINYAASSLIREVLIPGGTYRITNGITISSNVVVKGEGKTATFLTCYSLVTSPVTIQSRITIRDLCFSYPTQLDASPPTIFPPAIIDSVATGADKSSISNVRFLDCYWAISLGNVTTGIQGVTIQDCDGWVLRFFLAIDRAIDTTYIRGIFLNSNFLGTPAAAKRSWVFNNCQVFYLRRCDHVIINGVLAIAVKSTIVTLSGAGGGSTNMLEVSNILADINRQGLDLQNNEFQVAFTNCHFTGTDNYEGTADVGINCGGGAGATTQLQFSNCTFRHFNETACYVSATTMFSNCRWDDYNIAAGTDAGIELTANNITVQVVDCRFDGRSRGTARGIMNIAQTGTTITVSSTTMIGMVDYGVYQVSGELGVGSSSVGSCFFNANVVTFIGNAMARNAAPTLGTWTLGTALLNSQPTAGGPGRFVCYANGTPGTWAPTDQVGFRSGGASPVGVVVPLMVDEEWLDTVNVVWYKAVGATNADWVALNP